MGVRRSAFASRSERDNYYKLSRTWGDKFRIYHNLPFLNIFTVDDLREITQEETNRLKKTSVDFALCNDLDEFVLCIEFDGWLQGVSRGTEYEPKKQPENSWRKEITELKLRVAHASGFPYFVFSSDEFKEVSPDVPLTLADGIIGDVIASQTAEARYETFQSPLGVELSGTEAHLLEAARGMRFVSEPDKQLRVDWSLLFQVAAETDMNPIMRRAWELWDELGRPLYSEGFGAAMPTKDWPDDHPVKRMFPNGIPGGHILTIHSTDCGNVSVSLNLHDFQMPHYSPFRLESHMLLLMGLDKLKRMRKQRQ